MLVVSETDKGASTRYLLYGASIVAAQRLIWSLADTSTKATASKLLSR